MVFSINGDDDAFPFYRVKVSLIITSCEPLLSEEFILLTMIRCNAFDFFFPVSFIVIDPKTYAAYIKAGCGYLDDVIECLFQRSEANIFIF